MSTKSPCLVQDCKSEALKGELCHAKGQLDVMPSSKYVFEAFDNLHGPMYHSVFCRFMYMHGTAAHVYPHTPALTCYYHCSVQTPA